MDFSPLQIFFLITAAVVLGSATLAVITRNLVHAALWMVLSFFGVAIFFVLLGSGFFAVIQVVIYIGAIAVLIMFVIMLTNRDVHIIRSPGKSTIGLTLIAVIALLVLLATGIQLLPTANIQLPVQSDAGMVQQLGRVLVDPAQYGLIFELASLLLLVALIGAIYLAQDRNSGNGGEA